MKRARRLYFLLTFALLQCLAPVAHAHFGSDASDGAFHAFHFHQAQLPHALDHAPRLSSGSHQFHPSNLPVVRVPDGKRRNQASAPLIAPAMVASGIHLRTAAPAKFTHLNYARIPLPPPYFRQYAQAPPARA